MFKKSIVILLAGLMLQGCVSGTKPVKSNAPVFDRHFNTAPYVSDPNISQANNIARSVLVRDLEDSTVDSTEDYTEAFNNGVWTPLSGLYDIFRGDMASLMVVLIPRPALPEWKGHIWYWTPEGEPHLDIAQLSGDAFKQHRELFAAENAEASYVAPRRHNFKQFPYVYTGIEYKNADCNGIEFGKRVRVDCGITVFSLADGKVRLGNAVANFQGTIPAMMPDYIAPAGTKGKLTRADMHINLGNDGRYPEAHAPILEGLVAVSKSLPPTAYMYLAPGKYTILAESGRVEYSKVPLVLNQGKIMPFLVLKG